MVELLKQWYTKHFSDPQVAILILILVVGTGLLILTGHILGSVLTAIVIAYVLDFAVIQCERIRLPRTLSIFLVYAAFISILVLIIFGVLPFLWEQTERLLAELPSVFSDWQQRFAELPQKHPEFFAYLPPFDELTNQLRAHAATMAQKVVTFSLSSLQSFVVVLVYLVLVPIMVFFFLKDQDKILKWTNQFLPTNRPLLMGVWQEVDTQLGKFILGKIAQVFITGTISAITFVFLGLDYGVLLGALIGIGTLIPYVGPVCATIPTIIIALHQWGFETQFFYLLIAFVGIHFFDDNILSPWLFSETIQLHPLAIIIAVIFFGGIWGFWGVFFAIPLAILIKAVVDACSREKITAP